MMRQAASGWLVPLADLSLILFIVIGAGLNDGGGHIPVGAPARGVPVAVYVDVANAPPLARLLSGHTPAAGEQLTVVGYYAPGDREEVVPRAEKIAREAIAAGVEPRVIVQPAAETLVMASFAHDADPGLAHALQRSGD